jgi:hypothetical protein
MSRVCGSVAGIGRISFVPTDEPLSAVRFETVRKSRSQESVLKSWFDRRDEPTVEFTATVAHRHGGSAKKAAEELDTFGYLTDEITIVEHIDEHDGG